MKDKLILIQSPALSVTTTLQMIYFMYYLHHVVQI